MFVNKILNDNNDTNCTDALLTMIVSNEIMELIVVDKVCDNNRELSKNVNNYTNFVIVVVKIVI